MAKITDKEFDNLARLIVDTAGIQLDKGKEYLVEARLEPILERHGLESYDALYRRAISDTTGNLKTSIIDAITINETYFFRDNSPFELLKNKIIPDVIDRKAGAYGQRKVPLRIWSAACSTGQEVYSLSMTFKEMFLDDDRFEISILGTDISNEAVAKASYGKYNQFEIERGLSSHYLNKYFTKVANGWRIKDEIRAMARFIQMDLNRPFHKDIRDFDVILCRNVAIYFPVDVKIKLFKKLANSLNPGGALLVGGSESLAGLARDFVPRHYLNSVFYQLKKTSTATAEQPKTSPSARTRSNDIKLPKKRPLAAKTALSSGKTTSGERRRQTAPLPEQPPKAVEPLPPSPPPIVETPRPLPVREPSKQSLLDRLQSQNRNRQPPLPQQKSSKKQPKTSLLDQLKKREKKQP